MELETGDTTSPPYEAERVDGGTAESAAPLLAASIVVAAAVGLCLPKIGVAFGYDESVTVGAFVKTDSLWESVTSQLVANNHQAISVLNHLIWRIVGSDDEVVLRILPTAFFAVACGLFTWAAARRFRWPVGLVAGLVLCTNPMVFGVSRSIRGYGLMMLCAIASTILLLRAGGEDPPKRKRVLTYLIVATVGTSAQLYMLLVLLGQATACWVDARRRSVRAYLWPIGAGTIGVAVQLPLLTTTLGTDRGRIFRPGFPLEVIESLLGSAPIAIFGSAMLLAAAAPMLLRRRPLLGAAAAIAAASVAIWVFAPADLYTRFYVGISPAVALGISVGAKRLVGLGRTGGLSAALMVGMVLIGQLSVSLAEVGNTELGNREAGQVVDLAERNGLEPCVLATSAEALMGYAMPTTVRDTANLGECDLVVSLVYRWDEPAFPGLEEEFERELPLTAGETYGRVFTNADLDCLREISTDCRSEGQHGSD